MANLTLVILAAGIGSRYGGLKQADPIGPNGELIIHYSVYDALKAGFDKVVFLIRREIEGVFKERVGRDIEKMVEVTYAYQELTDVPTSYIIPEGRIKPWGTGHALWRCKDIVSTNFASINADDFYGAQSYRVLADFLLDNHDSDSQYSYALVGYTLNKTLSDYGYVSRGICEANSDGNLNKCVENKHIEKSNGQIISVGEDESRVILTGNEATSMNFWGFTPSIFKVLEKGFPNFLENDVPTNPLKAEYLLPNIVGNLVANKVAQVKVLSSNEQWYGVTNQEDRPIIQQAVRDLISKGIYPSKLF